MLETKRQYEKNRFCFKEKINIPTFQHSLECMKFYPVDPVNPV